MRIPRAPHRWSVSPQEAIAIQLCLVERVRVEPLTGPVRWVAGVDLAFSPDGESCIAGVVLWDGKREQAVESHVAILPVTFPYVPGLLSFREGRAVLTALRKLRSTPDVIMCDGHGRAHPRRFGLACHVGVIAEVPTIGCAKSILTGTYGPLDIRRGARAPLVDRGERVGMAIRTRTGVRPVFASVGHRIALSAATRLVLRSTCGYRLPEPTRLADRLVAAVRRDRF